MFTVFKPKKDNPNPSTGAQFSASWDEIRYSYIDNEPRNLELALKSTSGKVIGLESGLPTSGDISSTLKGLGNLISVGPVSGCDLSSYVVDPPLQAQYKTATAVEFTCEFIRRLYQLQPSFTKADILSWCSQLIGNGILTNTIFSSPAPFKSRPTPNPTTGTTRYRLFAPSSGFDAPSFPKKLDFSLKFTSASQRVLVGIKAGESEAGDFATIVGTGLKITLDPAKMSPANSGVYSQSVQIFDNSSKLGQVERASQNLQFDVSFLEKISIDLSALRNKSTVNPGIQNRQLKATVKFVNDPTFYSTSDARVGERLGKSNIFTWSTTGSLITVTPDGKLSVPTNNLSPTGTISQFFDALTKPTVENVTLSLASNVPYDISVPFSIMPGVRWYPLYAGTNPSDALSSLSSFSNTLNGINNTLQTTKAVVEQIQKVVPLLGIFNLNNLANALSILAGSAVDNLISTLNTGFYFTYLNPLDEGKLVEKGYLTAAAVQEKSKRSSEALSITTGLVAAGVSALTGAVSYVLDSVNLAWDLRKTPSLITKEDVEAWNNYFSRPNIETKVAFIYQSREKDKYLDSWPVNLRKILGRLNTVGVSLVSWSYAPDELPQTLLAFGLSSPVSHQLNKTLQYFYGNVDTQRPKGEVAIKRVWATQIAIDLFDTNTPEKPVFNKTLWLSLTANR